MLNILISGGTGLVGKHLSKKLKEKGYSVAVLSRTSKKNMNIPTYSWDIEKKQIDKEALETADCIIHLAGASIAEKRWTAKRKQLIIDSRVKSGQLIFDKVKESKNKLKVFISASAIGYYGAITSDKIFTEADSPANDFLGETCKQWERSADRFEELGIRTVKIRTGVVLSKQGGALEKMTATVKMGIGSPLGSGKQYMPWIHIDDLCGIYIKAIEDSQMKGAYNAVAPNHKTNSDFTKEIARVLKKPLWLPNVPSILLKIIFGSMSAMILKGSRVSSEKIKAAGYNFLFPDLEKALADLFKKN
ncbi:MAG: TIGR01777 family oxidoreductase [Bacteroidota bacterium]